MVCEMDIPENQSIDYKNAIDALRYFLKASRSSPQSEILKEFMRMILHRSRVSESGSILINTVSTQKLVLFNQDDFLVKEGYLQASVKETKGWCEEFYYHQGLAGLAFRTRGIQCVDNVDNSPDFFTAEDTLPFTSLVAIPILIEGDKQPFGVANFHNSASFENGILTPEIVSLLETYVEALGVALKASPRTLEMEGSKRAFVVHGRDAESLRTLTEILKRYEVDPVVLGEIPRTGASILEMLEDAVSTCSAGFVLLTPDDEGRLMDFAQSLRPRARQNVVFESGLLMARFRNSERVCFLIKDQVEMPSDIHGLFYEDYSDNNILSIRIEKVLRKWSMI